MPLVCKRRNELIQQVTMRPVQLDRIESRPLRPRSCFTVFLLQSFDIRERKFLRHFPHQGTGDWRRRNRDVSGVLIGQLPSGMLQLQRRRHAKGVYGLNQLRHTGHMGFLIDTRLVL